MRGVLASHNYYIAFSEAALELLHSYYTFPLYFQRL